MRLERFTVDDRELLDKLVFNSDVMTMNYGRVFTEDEAGSFFGAVTALNGRDDVFGYFKVFAGSGEEFIGLASLVPGEYPGHAETEYMLLPEYWGQGYGTELVSLLIDMAGKTGTVTVLEAITDLSNSRSRTVLQKNGFRSAGTFTNDEGESAELFTQDI